MPLKKADVVFENSVDLLKNSTVVNKSFYLNKLPKELRGLAFYVADLEKQRQMTRILQLALVETEKNGKTFKEFSDALDPTVYNKLERFRLEVVFRNNLSNTYNQSTRHQAVQNKDVTPYLLYDATLDEKTRPSHAELDGLILPADDPRWNELTPPLGHNCRCAIVPVTPDDARFEREAIGKTGLTTTKREYDAIVKKGGGPDKGFGGRQAYGNILGATRKAAQKAINSMKSGDMKDKFKKSLDEIGAKVDIWFEKNKNIFK